MRPVGGDGYNEEAGGGGAGVPHAVDLTCRLDLTLLLHMCSFGRPFIPGWVACSDLGATAVRSIGTGARIPARVTGTVRMAFVRVGVFLPPGSGSASISWLG